jgi:WD40-like Beta Propeller Repeat
VDRSYNSSNPTSGRSGLPAISPNGRFVAYTSTAANIVPNNAGANGNIYLYDLVNNATTLSSVNLAGNSGANYWSLEPEFSADGNTFVFQSYASDLSSLAFNRFGAIFAFNISSSASTNSTGANTAINVQINGFGVPGQNSGNMNPVISWPVASGNSYQVQFTDSLLNPVWQNVDGNTIFVGNSGQIIDLTPATSQRFYRIIVVP